MCKECEKEIKHLKGLLREAYPSSRLRRDSICGILLTGSSLLVSWIGKIAGFKIIGVFHLIHPVVAIPILLASLWFLCLARHLKKKEEEKKHT